MPLNAKQRKLAKKYDFKTKGKYYRTHGFDSKKEFWDAILETDAILTEIENEDKRKQKEQQKAVSKLTRGIFRKVVKKHKQEEETRRERQLKAEYYYDKKEKTHTVEYAFKNRNSEIGKYEPQDVYDFVLAYFTDITAALNVSEKKNGIKGKISVLLWTVKNESIEAELSKTN